MSFKLVVIYSVRSFKSQWMDIPYNKRENYNNSYSVRAMHRAIPRFYDYHNRPIESIIHNVLDKFESIGFLNNTRTSKCPSSLVGNVLDC